MIDFSELLEVDASSPSGLRWLKRVGQRTRIGDIAGCLIDDGTWVVTYRRKSYKAHHIVLELSGFPRPGPNYVADHRNFDLDDNRIENLRWITKSLCLSRRQCWYTRGVSGYKHVAVDSARRHQFRAVVRTQSGKRIYRRGLKTAKHGEALALKLEHHWID